MCAIEEEENDPTYVLVTNLPDKAAATQLESRLSKPGDQNSSKLFGQYGQTVRKYWANSFIDKYFSFSPFVPKHKPLVKIRLG